MTTGPCTSRCESVTAVPRGSSSVKSGACAPSLRAFSAAPELMSCPMGLSNSCSRPAGNQLAPSAINSAICCCNDVFVGIAVAMIVLLLFCESHCLSHFHRLLNSLQCNLDGDY